MFTHKILSKVILLFFFLNLSVSSNEIPINLPQGDDQNATALETELKECVSTLNKARNLSNLSNCLFQFRQLLVVRQIPPDRIKEYPDLLVLRKELDTYLDLFVSQMLTPKSNAKVPTVSFNNSVYRTGKQLIELLAVLQFSPIKTREMLNETIFSYNNLIILLGLTEAEQIEFYPTINSIGSQLQQVRSAL